MEVIIEMKCPDCGAELTYIWPYFYCFNCDELFGAAKKKKRLLGFICPNSWRVGK